MSPVRLLMDLDVFSGSCLSLSSSSQARCFPPVPAQTEQLIIEIHSCCSALCGNELPFCLPRSLSASSSPFCLEVTVSSFSGFHSFSVPASPLSVECLRVTTCRPVTVPDRSTVGDKGCFPAAQRCRAPDNSKHSGRTQPVVTFLGCCRIFETCTVDCEHQGS